jgi:hypothetical protein
VLMPLFVSSINGNSFSAQYRSRPAIAFNQVPRVTQLRLLISLIRHRRLLSKDKQLGMAIAKKTLQTEGQRCSRAEGGNLSILDRELPPALPFVVATNGIVTALTASRSRVSAEAHWCNNGASPFNPVFCLRC